MLIMLGYIVGFLTLLWVNKRVESDTTRYCYNGDSVINETLNRIEYDREDIGSYMKQRWNIFGAVF